MNGSNEQIINRKVLFLCDDSKKEEFVKLVLRERNDEVRCASYSREVLAEADQNPPDLIIIDLFTTGTDTDSFEAYRQLRALTTLQTIPVLFLGAAVVRQAFYSRVQSLGVEGCLLTPWWSGQLLAARDALVQGGTYYPSYGDQ